MMTNFMNKSGAAGRNIGQEYRSYKNEKGNSPGLQTYKDYLRLR